MSRRREGVREGVQRTLNVSTANNILSDTPVPENEVLASTVKMFDFHKQTLLANVLSFLDRFSKFLIQRFGRFWSL